MIEIKNRVVKLVQEGFPLGERLKSRALVSGYGFEIFDFEYVFVVLISWGQDSEARVTVVTTAIDGGWSGQKSACLMNNFKCQSEEEIIARVSYRIKKFLG